MDEEKLIKELGVINIQKGDVIVIKTENRISQSCEEEITKQITEVTAFKGCQVIVLDKGMDMEVYRKTSCTD